MRVLIDLNHPAHVHFFKIPIRLLLEDGHQVVCTSREKDVTLPLLENLGIDNIKLSGVNGKGLVPLGLELLKRNYSLHKFVKKYKPEVMVAIGGTFVAHVGSVTNTSSVVFYDTENAKLQNAITYPFASCVVVPSCYQSWTPRNHIRYAGYHELSYLYPKYFTPDRNKALQNGLDPSCDNYFIRLVSWGANHDFGERGWSVELLRWLIARLSESGNVIVSAEETLPAEFSCYRYLGSLEEIHHVLAFCRMYIGESATMASESAVLGVPAIYAAHTGRGYTDEQEAKYGLVCNVRNLERKSIVNALDRTLSKSAATFQIKRQRLLEDSTNVAEFVSDCIIDYRRQLRLYRNASG